VGKRELRKLKSNLGKIDELYGERKALEDKLATAKKDIKKFTFTGPNEEVIHSLSEEIDSIEQEIKAHERKVAKLERKLKKISDRKMREGSDDFEDFVFSTDFLLPGLIFLIGISALLLDPDPPGEIPEDQSDEQGTDELVAENTTSSYEPSIYSDVFIYSCCFIGPLSSIIAYFIYLNRPEKLDAQKSILTRKKNALNKSKRDLKNAKSAESASIKAPKLAERLPELDAEIEELYSEVKHLIPFSDILEK